MHKPYIIAEIGSSWLRPPYDNNGISLALRNIDDAAACGVSAVKFQYFSHEELYGIPGDCKYQLPREWLSILSAYASRRWVDFMVSAFSVQGIKEVDPHVKAHKIASSEMMDFELVSAAVRTKKPVVISTGGASKEEVMHLLKTLDPTNIYLLECVAKYPAYAEDYDLSTLGDEGWACGISDHTLDNDLAICSVGAGAYVFEKHFDCLKGVIDTAEPSPDTPVSIGTSQLKQYVSGINNAYSAVHQERHTSVADAMMNLKWRRRLKITKLVKGGQDALIYGENFGSFRSLAADTKAASPIDKDKFEGKRTKRDMHPQDGLWFDDIY